MITKIQRRLAACLIAALFISTNIAVAQGGDTLAPPKSIWHALLNSVIFASVGMLMVAIGIKVFDKATPSIVLEKELLANNTAVAIVTAAVIIGISIIVAASMM